MFTGPPAARPTNAAVEVPTPSIGFDCAGTSSTYTPGLKYVGMSLPSSVHLVGAELVQEGIRPGRAHPARQRVAGVEDLHLGLVPRPQDHLRLGSGVAQALAELARRGVAEVDDDRVRPEAPRRLDERSAR